MSIELELSTPSNASNPTSLEEVIQSNNEAIKAALLKAVSREGGSLNYMWADLDLNGYRLLNVGESDFLTARDVAEIQAGQFRVNESTEDLEYKGPDDGDFIILYTKASLTGPAGAGNGDLESSNNLSDVSDLSSARTNLGLEIGADVLAYDSNLDGFDPLDKADKEDSRFSSFNVTVFTVDATLSNEGHLYRFGGSTGPVSLTLQTSSDGAVFSLHNPVSSPVTLSIVAPIGKTLYLQGSDTSSPSLSLAPGGFASIICSDTAGNSFIASGTNLTVT